LDSAFFVVGTPPSVQLPRLVIDEGLSNERAEMQGRGRKSASGLLVANQPPKEDIVMQHQRLAIRLMVCPAAVAAIMVLAGAQAPRPKTGPTIPNSQLSKAR
jgi:hypothetical protein